MKQEFLFKNIKVRMIDQDPLPDKKTVSAVFLIGFINGKIIAARNERGWDIPGGHVEKTDLTLADAVARETNEEAGVSIKDPIPYASIQFDGNSKVMLIYACENCKMHDFVPSEDSFERELMEIPEFISKYCWGDDIITLLIDKAQSILIPPAQI